MNGDLGFTFKEKNGEFFIYRKGKKVTTLRGEKAISFQNAIQNSSFFDQQQLMARVTGNYKRGNEKVAKNHPKNK